MAKGSWSPYVLVEHPVPDLVPLLCCYNNLRFSGKGLPLDFGERLWENHRGQMVTLGEEVWGAIGIPVHPKDVR